MSEPPYSMRKARFLLSKRALAAMVAVCLALPGHAYALRSSVEGVQAGLEEKLRSEPFPAVEVLQPQRVEAARSRLKMVLWAFDDTLWTGYPHDEANRYFAQRLGLDVRNARIMKSVHEFIHSASGLPWHGVVAQLRARGWSPPDDMTEEIFLPEWRKFVDGVVMRDNLTDPKEHLARGGGELLTAFKTAGIQQKIATGADAESRRRYAERGTATR